MPRHTAELLRKVPFETLHYAGTLEENVTKSVAAGFSLEV